MRAMSFWTLCKGILLSLCLCEIQRVQSCKIANDEVMGVVSYVMYDQLYLKYGTKVNLNWHVNFLSYRLFSAYQ